MEAEAEQIVELVVARCDLLEQLTNGRWLPGLQRAGPCGGSSPAQRRGLGAASTGGGGAEKASGLVKVSTITVESPTAAEHTMQPASMRENSCRSFAACMSWSAQATRATTAATMRMARRCIRGGGNPKRADTADLEEGLRMIS
jgi:hypothetical protein